MPNIQYYWRGMTCRYDSPFIEANIMPRSVLNAFKNWFKSTHDSKRFSGIWFKSTHDNSWLKKLSRILIQINLWLKILFRNLIQIDSWLKEIWNIDSNQLMTQSYYWFNSPSSAGLRFVWPFWGLSTEVSWVGVTFFGGIWLKCLPENWFESTHN